MRARRQTDNLLGALALSVTDRMDAVTAAAGRSASAAAALSAMAQFLDGASVERLRQVLGLSHSGTVRLVDGLVEDGLVQRLPAADARSTAVTLSAAGHAAAAETCAAREAVLHNLTAVLDAQELRQLQHLLSKKLTGVVATKDGGAWICRRGDVKACGRNEGKCPTAKAAAIKYGTAVPETGRADRRH